MMGDKASFFMILLNWQVFDLVFAVVLFWRRYVCAIELMNILHIFLISPDFSWFLTGFSPEFLTGLQYMIMCFAAVMLIVQPNF